MTDFILRVELAYMKKESKPNKTETVGPRKLATKEIKGISFLPANKFNIFRVHAFYDSNR